MDIKRTYKDLMIKGHVGRNEINLSMDGVGTDDRVIAKQSTCDLVGHLSYSGC